MKKNKTKKKNVNDKKRKLLRLCVFIVVGLMFINTAMQQPQILKNKAKIASLEEQIEYEKQKAAQVDAFKEKVGTDEYIEKIARDKLGLIKENEIVFVDVAS